MRKLSAAAAATILAIVVYFALFWGFDALRMLTSPTYGLEDVWRSQFVFEIGRIFGLGPVALIKLAAFFATVKLAVAGICAAHIADRFRMLGGGTARSDILDGALILIMFISFASVGPAIWMHNTELVREQTITLMLVGVAAGLGILERKYERDAAGQAAEVDAGVTRDPAPLRSGPRFRFLNDQKAADA
jgi:hypothetical protein